MAKKGIGLPQTKGIFEVRGFSTGMKRENALKNIKTKSKKDMRILNFGIQAAPESTTYVTIQGIEKDEVYFGKKAEVKGEKGEVLKVKWSKRFEEQPEGFRLMGVSVGLEKDEDGKNIVENCTEFDAAKKIHKKLEDNTPVYVRGDLEFSSFINEQKEKVKSKRFAVKSLYLAKDIDFDDEEFEETNNFKQKIIFMGISKVDDKNDPRFLVDAKVVTYNSVEDIELIVRNTALASQFKKSLKPYQAIDVWGKIYNKIDAEEIEESSKSVWGEEDSFKVVNKAYIRELVITGADPGSIDEETYSEEAIEEALKALNEFGDTTDESESTVWDTDAKNKISDDDLPW